MTSSFGKHIQVSIFGESHGDCIGCEVKGLPKGEAVDLDALQAFLDRRKPGREGTTPRNEADVPEFSSGLTDGVTDGTVLKAVIYNHNQHSSDYEDLSLKPRPSHADFSALAKYGTGVDLRGGGHFSGRLTAPLCVAGGIAKQMLERRGIFIGAHLYSIGEAQDTPFPLFPTKELFDEIAAKELPVLSDRCGKRMQKELKYAIKDQDSVGGTVECTVIGLPAGLGGPRYEGVESRFSEVLFGIPAVKGVAFGEGFLGASCFGSEYNDPFCLKNGKVQTETNHVGGVLGGITNGMPVNFTVAFKPTPSIGTVQKTVDLQLMEETLIQIQGRHDPCVAIRAVPVIEAAAALVVLDLLMEDELTSDPQDIASLRGEIDTLDQELLSLFRRRMEVSQSIAAYKKEHDFPVLNEEREKEVILHARSLAPGMEDYAEDFVKELMKLSKDYQTAWNN